MIVGPSNNVRYTLTNKDSQSLRCFLKSRQNALGNVVTRLSVVFYTTGAATHFANILRDYLSINLETVQQAAIQHFSDTITHTGPIPSPLFTTHDLDPGNDPADKTIFHSQVNYHALAKLLNNTLTAETTGILALRKDEFTFLDLTPGHDSRDGQSMLLLAMQKADPSMIVGVDLLRSKIEQASLHTYKNNIDKMCDNLEETYQKIIYLVSKFESMRRHVLRALSL